MFVIFEDDGERFASGDTFQDACDTWESYYDQPPRFTDVIVVQGKEMKAKVILEDVKQPVAKPTTKQGAK